MFTTSFLQFHSIKGSEGYQFLSEMDILSFEYNNISPKRVFKAIVRSTRIHQVCSSQLFNVSQSLELRSVDDLHQQGVQLHMSMNRVIEDLQEKKTSVC